MSCLICWTQRHLSRSAPRTTRRTATRRVYHRRSNLMICRHGPRRRLVSTRASIPVSRHCHWQLTPRLTPFVCGDRWNRFGCSVTGKVLMDTADAFVSLGLDRIGFEFVNSDDCWMQKNRTDGGAGPMQPQPAKFPKGVKSVADYIHARHVSPGRKWVVGEQDWRLRWRCWV